MMYRFRFMTSVTLILCLYAAPLCAKPSASKEGTDKLSQQAGREGAMDSAPLVPDVDKGQREGARDPVALAMEENAMPAPPSMESLLAQGGGQEEEAAAFADARADKTRKAPASSSLALGFGLFLMGGGLGAGAMMTRRKRSGALHGAQNLPELTQVKSIRLSPKHQISLVDVQGQQLVVGITSAQMTLLATLDGPHHKTHDALLDFATTQHVEEPQGASPDQTPRWDELFSSALRERASKLAPRRAPETPPSPAHHAEALLDDVEHGLPPALTSGRAEEVCDEQSDVQSEERSSLHETSEYTLEEGEAAADSASQGAQEDSSSHDGMFASHDAEREPVIKARRSRESDSMLIALAAMREEMGR